MRRAAAITRSLSALALALAPSLARAEPPAAKPADEALDAAEPAAAKPADTKPPAAKPADAKPTAGEVALWVPRIITYPVYALTEYGLRRPLEALLDAAEQRGLLARLERLFTFGPRGTFGVVPIGHYELGQRPRVGVHAFADDLLARGNQLRAHATFGGSDALALALADRFPIDEGAELTLRVEASTRPDQLFYGIGPRSLEASRAVYGLTSYEGAALFHLTPTPYLQLDAQAGLRSMRFSAFPGCCGQTPLLVRSALDGASRPPAFERGYVALTQRLHVALDSRRPRPDPGSGLRFAGSLEHGIDLADAGSQRFIKYGGELHATLDLDGKRRLLTLSLVTRFVDPGGRAEVPFTELVSLGGDELLLGYRPSRLLGRSAAAAVLDYRYPIGRHLEGSAQIAIGNVFGPHLDDFSPKRLRFSFDAGLHTTTSRDLRAHLVLGSGTETFDDGAALTALRLLVGATRHF
jgi:hypothetical protein